MPADGTSAIADPVLTFVSQIDGLHTSLPLAMMVIQGAARTAQTAYQTFVDEYCEKKEEDGRRSILVPLDHEHRFAALNRRARRTSTAHAIVPRSFLVSLVSQYDAFLGSLVRAILSSRHEMLKASGLMLSFSQLSEFNSIAAARDYILEKEIENLLRKSHVEQFDWLEEKFGLKLREGLPVWPKFIEVTERRNLFVHCDGVASSQYFKVCRENKVVVEEPETITRVLIFAWGTIAANEASQPELMREYKTAFEAIGSGLEREGKYSPRFFSPLSKELEDFDALREQINDFLSKRNLSLEKPELRAS
jgi:hypothetical protein